MHAHTLDLWLKTGRVKIICTIMSSALSIEKSADILSRKNNRYPFQSFSKWKLCRFSQRTTSRECRAYVREVKYSSDAARVGGSRLATLHVSPPLLHTLNDPENTMGASLTTPWVLAIFSVPCSWVLYFCGIFSSTMHNYLTHCRGMSLS